MDEPPAASMSKTRTAWFSGLAVLFSLVFGLPLFGWVGLLGGWFMSGSGEIHRVHNIAASGVATGILVATPLLILAWRRDDIALLQMVGVAAVATAIGSVLAFDRVFLIYVVILAVPVVVLLAVSRAWGRYVARGAGLVPELLLAAAVAAPFWAAFAWTNATFQRTRPANDPHVEMHHYAGMAIMAIGLVLMVVLASLRTPGWRIDGWLTGIGSAVYGAASITFPDSPGSEGASWGALAIAWGVAIVALIERRARSG